MDNFLEKMVKKFKNFFYLIFSMLTTTIIMDGFLEKMVKKIRDFL